MELRRAISALPLLLVVAYGVLVLYAWDQGFYWITSLGSDVTVKPATATSCILAGAAALFGRGKAEIRDLSVLLNLACVALLVVTMFEVYLGTALVRWLPVEPVEVAVASVGPGIPSWGTALGFGLVCASGTLQAVGRGGGRVLAGLSALIGCSGVLGYIVGAPEFYFHVDGYSTAMAFGTAVSLILLALERFRS